MDHSAKQVRVPPASEARARAAKGARADSKASPPHWTEEVSKLVEAADHAAALEIERELSKMLNRTKNRIKKFAAGKQAIGLAYAGEGAAKGKCGTRFDPGEKEYEGECG
jgi:hypothetical protein